MQVMACADPPRSPDTKGWKERVEHVERLILFSARVLHRLHRALAAPFFISSQFQARPRSNPLRLPSGTFPQQADARPVTSFQTGKQALPIPKRGSHILLLSSHKSCCFCPGNRSSTSSALLLATSYIYLTLFLRASSSAGSASQRHSHAPVAGGEHIYRHEDTLSVHGAQLAVSATVPCACTITRSHDRIRDQR